MRGRPRKQMQERVDAVAEEKAEEEKVVKKQEAVAKKVNKEVESWLAVQGDKILKRTRNAVGSVHTRYLGNKKKPEFKKYLEDKKKEGVKVEAL